MARLNVVPFPASSFQSVFPQPVKPCSDTNLLAAWLKPCPDTNHLAAGWSGAGRSWTASCAVLTIWKCRQRERPR